ncbi:Inner membrane protein YrbG [Burkholderiales bacterium]|nr:Inner membrane protein YrbG [Burkholderiales bacterium]
MTPGPIELLLIGVALAAAGGELFVRGTVGLAERYGLPPALVAVTVAAFATSSPELAVAIDAARAGVPQIALGNALGANVVNVALVFGLALLVAPIRLSRAGLGRDLPAAIVLPLATALFAATGTISRTAAAVLFAIFCTWLALTIRDMRGHAEKSGPPPVGRNALRSALVALAGGAMLWGAGGAIVAGASALAERHGWDPFVVGATLVALGTTTPELATMIVARWKGHDDVGAGTLLGSNLFNGGVIVPVAAAFAPIPTDLAELAIPLGAALVAILLLVSARSAEVGRARGALLVACYAAYVAVLALGSAA